jgi:aminopeptidase N
MFGEYPFIKEKYGIAEFLWYSGAMEHQTITGVSTRMVGVDYNFNDVYIHELAHHWWGNAVTIKDWKDIWLNEGFASYSEALYFEHIGNTWLFKNKMEEFAQFEENGTLYNPSKNLFSSMVYHKGAWVLHMLRAEVGDAIFFKILRDYYSAFKYNNVTSQDFISVCERVASKDLTTFFNQWLFGNFGRPRLTYHWKYDRSAPIGSELKITIEQSGRTIFSIPLVVAIEGTDIRQTIRLDQPKQTIFMPCKGKPVGITLDPDQQLLADISGSGE